MRDHHPDIFVPDDGWIFINNDVYDNVIIDSNVFYDVGTPSQKGRDDEGWVEEWHPCPGPRCTIIEAPSRLEPYEPIEIPQGVWLGAVLLAALLLVKLLRGMSPNVRPVRAEERG